MITISDGTQRPQADEVLARFKTLIEQLNARGHLVKKGILSISVYQNCRERGYHIENSLCEWDKSGMAVSFSENRNSDDIVVYYGFHENFAFNTNIPDEDTYRNRARYFKYQDYNSAANFIYDYLLEGRVDPK